MKRDEEEEVAEESPRPRVYEKAVFKDDRGYHVKLFGKTPEKIAVEDFQVHEVFMTVNKANVIRGLHLQEDPQQPKILSCVEGRALVHVVCLDPESEHFLKVERLHLSGDLKEGPGRQLVLVPAKHALGYRSLEKGTRMLYLAGSDFNPAGDVGIHPFDETLALKWGIQQDDAVLSQRDRELPPLSAYLEGLERWTS